MLVSLRIENLAIMDSVYLEFHPGFNVISGETGAGKSIILGALDLLLGGRATQDMVRAQCDQAEVEGLFDLNEGPGRSALKEMDLAEEDQSILLIRRIIGKNGRNRVMVNGRQVTSSMLKAITTQLLDMSGQHAHYALLSPEQHLHLLDRFSGSEAELADYVDSYSRMKALEQKEKEWMHAEVERLEREDFIRFQLGEILETNPQPEEDDELDTELRQIRDQAFLSEGTLKSAGALASENGNALQAVQRATRLLEPLLERDERLHEPLERLSNVRIELEDLSFELSRWADSVHAGSDRVDAIEMRLADLRKIKRKHGPTLEAVLEKKRNLEEEINRFDNLDQGLHEVRLALIKLREGTANLAAALTRKREEGAIAMARGVEQELKALALPKCKFRVVVSETRTPQGEAVFGENGANHVQFEIAPNPGEGFSPLHKIASGGELSRILLAIKSALTHTDPVSTSVFDEVDSGIGGGTAEQVGRKLRKTAQHRQVIAISHLPQTIAYGERHFLVAKNESDGRTTTQVRQLGSQDRMEELARMLGGVVLTPQSRAHAAEMLESSLAWQPDAA